MLLLCLSGVAVEFTGACDAAAPLAERMVCMESALCSMGTLTAVRKSAPSYCFFFQEQERRVVALMLCCRLRVEVTVHCVASTTVSRLPFACSSCSEARFTPWC